MRTVRRILAAPAIWWLRRLGWSAAVVPVSFGPAPERAATRVRSALMDPSPSRPAVGEWWKP